MAPLVSSHLIVDKTLRRLMSWTEEQVENKSIEDWKLNQSVNTLQRLLVDLRKSIKRPSSKQLDEYQQRIERLRQQIDLTKLDDQTFPRHKLFEGTSKESLVKNELLEKKEIVASQTVEPSKNDEKPSNLQKNGRSNHNRRQETSVSAHERQDQIINSMEGLTRRVRNNAERLKSALQDDKDKVNRAREIVNRNTEKLQVQSRRLKHNAYNTSNCWIYLMLIVVMITFIYLALFMRVFRKPLISASRNKHTDPGKASSFLDNSINHTSINQTNLTTTTKSTDYISLLLNYANDNHTDL